MNLLKQKLRGLWVKRGVKSEEGTGKRTTICFGTYSAPGVVLSPN